MSREELERTRTELLGGMTLAERRAFSEQLRDAALAYAAAGWRVHPLYEGAKRGRLPEWQKVATSDVAQVERWWGQWPYANIGILCGEGLVVFDVDLHGDADGFETVAYLARQGFHLPEGPIAESAGGGAHHWLRVSQRVGKKGSFLPGVDLLGEATSVVVPPSRTPTGRYTWITPPPGRLADLPPAPSWLLAVLRGKEAPPPSPRPSYARPRFPQGDQERWFWKVAEKWVAEMAHAAPGTRHDMLVQAAMAIVGASERLRVDPAAALDSLRVAAERVGIGADVEGAVASARRKVLAA